MTNDINKIINDIPECARAGVLEGLLGLRRQNAPNSIFAFDAKMGQAPSYIASVSLSWISQHVKFAADLPEFSGKVDSESKKVKIDSSTMDLITQRQLDWRRQQSMSAYLAAWEKHKFPPLLIVGREKWVDDPQSECWSHSGKATRDSVLTTPLGHGCCELSVHSDVTFYALDGQHRLMAIHGLQTLIDEKELPALNQTGKPKKHDKINLQRIADIIRQQSGKKLSDENETIAHLQGIMSEKIGVEIIPAVLEQENIAEAKFRLRNVFVDVNENAKKPTTGDSILLDETNGFRMVARFAMGAHSLLKDRVGTQTSSLSESSNDYTTLETLEKIATVYLGYMEDFQEWGKLLIPGDKSSMCRPKSEGDFEAGWGQMHSYFSGLMNLPSHRCMCNGTPASKFREKEGHILFRPVVQVAFAEAIAILDRDYDIFQVKAMDILIRQEECGQLQLKNPDAPWCGVIWDPAQKMMRPTEGNRKLCTRLFVHLLGGRIDKEELKKLQEDFAAAREIYDLSSQLPDPWK